MRPRAFLLLTGLLLLARCGTEREERRSSRLEHTSPPPAESRPIRQGFTQRPPRNAPGLPPPIEPLFTAEEERAMSRAALVAPDEERERATSDLLELIERLERPNDVGPGELDELVARARETAIGHALGGRIHASTVEELYSEFLFPNDVEAATDRYAGRVVLLAGTVAPHNMLDLADGFKLFERTPYVHEPLLLATEHELSFVRCHLARKEEQKLRDWEEIHLLGVVEGKSAGDVILRRCVVL